jgi:hypothetical protein
MERLLHAVVVRTARARGEKSMKIYLLMVLIGTLLTAIRFTSAPEQPSKSLSQ